MTKITEEQLIESLNQLKEIKPNKEWASLLKSQILAEEKNVVQPARFVGIMDTLRFIFAPRKLAYSFAVVLFLAVGIFGLNKFVPTGKVPQQPASLASQTPAAVKEQINVTVKGLVQNLKNNPDQNPQAIRILAKTLADMPGDVVSSSDVQDLYKTLVANQIVDIQKTTLTDAQQKILLDTVTLYNTGKYNEALEKVLLINK